MRGLQCRVSNPNLWDAACAVFVVMFGVISIVFYSLFYPRSICAESLEIYYRVSDEEEFVCMFVIEVVKD